MIRFCDREVGFVEYDSLNRIELLEYFTTGHEEDVLCVYDDFTSMGYIGKITLYSLQHSININSAIQEEYVILNKDMWYEARDFFAYRYGISKNNFLLPVFNKEGQLICFAYEDEDANREIRQLRELSEQPEALQFPDIYPEYKYVKIHEFNELAYFLAKYLESRGVAVQVEGAMWQEVFSGEECSVPDYDCLNIYAEGSWEKKRNWRENLLRSVSVEFECIDKIYEANIKNGTIKDAKGSCTDLLESLRGEEEIILYGTGREEQNAYDYLKGNGIEVCCFIGKQYEERDHLLFGKSIISVLEARSAYKNAVFIDCTAKNSAWGFGGVDYYDYIGYRRNERFILIKDYLEIPENSLLNLLKDVKIVLAGDVSLCQRLFDFLKQKQISVIGYLRGISEAENLYAMPEVCADTIDEKPLCLIIVPEYYRHESRGWKGGEKRKQIKKYLEEKQIENYTDYFSDMISFISIERNIETKYTREWMMPKRIILGSIESFNGNDFFRTLLDSHPEIAIMHYSDLNNNLFWICASLAMEDATNILPVFWKMIEGDEKKIFNPSAFNEKMQQLLSYGSRFTSQELFVMFHISYMYMCGRNITDEEVRNMIIYWEPHHTERSALEDCIYWLREDSMQCDIINVVRNICMQNGSSIKAFVKHGIRGAYVRALHYPDIDKKNYAQSDRLIVKFEDLKCKPEETLAGVCNSWGIMWSDTLMQTSHFGEKALYTDSVHTVSGFDLAPVYNTYENFFSEFDRFRMTLINAPWQRKYGYPYVEISRFTRRELQEMFLKGFRFENLGDTERFKDSLDYRIELQMQIRAKLQKTRMIELMELYLHSLSDEEYIDMLEQNRRFVIEK